VWWCPCLDRVDLLALDVECVYKENYLCLKYILKFRVPFVCLSNIFNEKGAF
jgi:hypothetical protein